MIKMTKEELYFINGGLNLTGTLVNSFTRSLNIILDISRSLGTAIRRIFSNKLCPL